MHLTIEKKSKQQKINALTKVCWPGYDEFSKYLNLIISIVCVHLIISVQEISFSKPTLRETNLIKKKEIKMKNKNWIKNCWNILWKKEICQSIFSNFKIVNKFVKYQIPGCNMLASMSGG